uniref:Uncharacterized protein n=1 Tax=viral metagenome TaxID=1070528 RepID=A0A6C0ADX7_9ZZZZ
MYSGDVKKIIECEHSDEIMTLNVEDVTDLNFDEFVGSQFEIEYSKLNQSGWIIKAFIKNDYYSWIEKFTAFHLTYGCLEGDLSLEDPYINCDSEEAYNHFLKHHKFRVFCKGNI